MPIIRVLEIFALFASSKKMRKLKARKKWEVSYVYQSIWHLMQKLQARELPGWTIPQKQFTLWIIGVLQYTVYHILIRCPK